MFEEFDMILVGIGEEFDENANAVKAYEKLKTILEGKNFFIVTLCMDDAIYKAGFDESRIVAPLGGSRFKQCPDACTHDLFSLDETVCPNCGKELIFNNILAENYVEEGYLPQWEKHKKWISGTLNRKLLTLDLGTSLRFPQIIRFPFEKITMINDKAKMIRVNEKLWQIPAEISEKAESVKQSAVEWLISL